MPAWDPKRTKLDHCCEAELAKDEIRPMLRGVAYGLFAKNGDDAAEQGRTNKSKTHVGASRDALMAKIRLLHEAHQGLAGSSGDQSTRDGKEKLSLGETLLIFDDMSKLWQGNADIDNSNAILVERDELAKDRHHLMEKLEEVEQQRDRYQAQYTSGKHKRDSLLQELDGKSQESETLKQELHTLRQEKEQDRQEINELQSRSLCHEEERETYLREYEYTRERINDHQTQALELKTQLDHYREETRTLQQQQDTLRQEKEQYLQDMNSLYGRSDCYKQERETYRQKHESTHEQMIHHQTRASELKTQLDHYRDESRTLKQQRDKLRQEKEQDRQEIDDSHRRSVRYKKERDMGRQERDGYLEHKDSMEQQRDTLLQEQSHHRQESETIKQECDNLRQGNEQYRQRLSEEKAAKKSIERDLNEVQRERDEYLHCSKERDRALKSAREQTVQDQTRVSELEGMLNDATFQLKSSRFKKTELAADLSRSRSTLDEERRESSSRFIEFERDIEANRREERRTLQMTANVKLNGVRNTCKHDIRRLQDGYELEKADFLASVEAGRHKIKDLELTAESTERSYMLQMKSLELSRQATASAQETVHGSVVTVAVLRSSYNDLLGAFTGRGGIIKSHILHSQEMNERLTKHQEATAKDQAQMNQLQTQLHGAKEELHTLSTAYGELHDARKRDQRLQLGRADRKSLFENFADFARSLSGRGMIFKGKEGSRDVDVCICVLSGSNEALCVIRRLGDAFTIWHSKMEDCSTFGHAWRQWLCLGGGNQGKPIYISLRDPEKEEWLREWVALRPVANAEVDMLA